MTKTLQFKIRIDAPRPAVYETMLGPETYKAWTAPFCDGSHYQGSWDKGAKMRFLAPNGDGMVAEIAENRRNDFVSIRHLGEISGGVEDTTSEKVKSWAPAHENYTFVEVPGGTEVRVDVEILPEYEQYMLETYPKALDKLKAICEA